MKNDAKSLNFCTKF